MRLSTVGVPLLSVGAVLGCAQPAGADIITLPSHERTYQSTFGSFTVGDRDEFINRIAPLNQVGTTREALVSNMAYARVDGIAGGQLKTGYHVGCSVTLPNGNVGVIPQAYVPTVDVPGSPAPTVHIIGPNIQVPMSVNLAPGEVKDLEIATKDLIPGKTVQVIIRDFHIAVNQCAGPVSIRQYTYIYAKSAETDDSGAVFGDPTWL
ncbi:MspA family porin [Nocardia sp. CDC153]|uniref:MspA family porin n=1 Tax=Nocardia sp. CDC153 TaxID=3112167 RepID=UPI002DBADC9C|nr:MspA family porin [Nocardia sp. CDC153]MEC3958502.1 MspA family porin [Nocardia sp. CDC153]